ncbi:hypothetical protein L3X38_016684 [Prunus dulcis]|uniref:Uncharacterized protein n=1 Tax=Prunus dulcis TaxID=3755 RepID=A0AAD4W5U8_PRUDU|nr:hypothetical protein L3X38_016684 [Prunus dulcis]
MKAMPLPFEQFQRKGLLDFSSSTSDSQPLQNQHLHHHHNQQQQQQKWNQNRNKENCYVGSTEPNISSSTLSSSLGGVASGCGGFDSGSTDNHLLGHNCRAVYENISQTPLEESNVSRRLEWRTGRVSCLSLRAKSSRF